MHQEQILGCAWTPRKANRQALVIAHNGVVWHWNSGWRVMERKRGEKNYTPKATQKTPLGHAAFRSRVQLLIKSKPEERQILLGVEKPGQPWRRIVGGGLYNHFLYGNVKVRATDGIHAIVEEADGMILQVMFDNLTELKPQAELKAVSAKTIKEKSTKDGAAERKKKSQELLAKLMDMSA